MKGTKDRELVAWAPTEATSATSATWLSGGIEGGDSSGPWDQFSANKELFGVETSFQVFVCLFGNASLFPFFQSFFQSYF